MPFLRERSGVWSPLKITAFAGVCLPALWILCRFWIDDLGPRPVTEVIHRTGDWTVRLIWISLAITPAARLFRQPKLLLARRTVGVTAAAYAFAHFALYIVDQKFNLATVASEIVLRIYLTIGFVALAGLVALMVTSTDGMIRRLGKRWTQLHRLVYPIAILAAIHFLLQSKNDVWQPILMVGFLVWLFGYRLLQRYATTSYVWLATLAIASGALTMVIEILWYRFRSNVPVERIVQLNFDFSYIVQPAWWVLIIALAIPLAAWLWSLRPQRPKARKSSGSAVSGATRVQSAS